jgi:hypothetical protein
MHGTTPTGLLASGICFQHRQCLVWQQRRFLVHRSFISCMHASMQVLQEPQWCSFKFATDVITEKGFMRESMQPCRHTGSPTAAATCHHRKEHGLKECSDLLRLCRRQQAACSALASHMHSCIQVLYTFHPTTCSGLSRAHRSGCWIVCMQ